MVGNDSTLEKIGKIINEIEGNNISITQDSGRKKTTEEIVNILLNRSEGKEMKVETNTETSINDLKNSLSTVRDNCEIRYYREIFSVRKVIGGLLVFFRRTTRRLLRFLIEPILDDQNRFNQSVLNVLEQTYQELVLQKDEKAVLENRLNDAEERNRELSLRLEEKTMRLEEKTMQLEEKTVQLEEKTVQLERKDEQLQEKVVQLESEENSLKNKLETTKEELTDKIDVLCDEIDMKLLRSQKKEAVTVKRVDGVKEEETSEKDSYSAIDYFSFENYFRGSRRKVSETQKQYLQYFRNKGTILDIGCGRGEFLELLKKEEITAKGVDFYPEFAEYCVMKELDVVCGDGIEYLKSVEDSSLGGIFASQLVEHLTTEQIVELCKLAYEKLDKGTCMILETPNPTCLSIYTNAFYMDPSHQKPVHPKTLEYLAKEAGFLKTEIIFTENSKVPYKLPLLDGENIKNLEEFNNGINCLSDIMFGSQDYAIIAYK